MAALEDQMQSMLPSADDDIRPEDYPQYKPDDFTGRSFAADSFQETKDRFMDAGKIDVDPDDPAIFTAYKRAVDYLKDTGLAGLGLADTAFKYAVGSVAQVMPTEQLEKRMARDLYSMPEAFAGAAGAKSITQLDDAADAFLAGSKQVAQKLKTEYDPTMVRSFVGAIPPTYQKREDPLSSLSRESDPASDEYLNLLNLESLMFREPIAEFAKTVNIPKKGLLGSEFLNQIKKNPSIPETSIQDEIIDPSKRYTRDELLDVVEGRGISQSFANIAKNKVTQFEQYQRQRRDAGFVGGTEIDYFDIPVVSNVGFPGKKFKAHSQHYEDGTLVHVRGSILNTNVEYPLADRDLIAFDTIIDDDNFLLVEEIQSDLLTKGYAKPKSPFDRAFNMSANETMAGAEVTFDEAYGDLSNELRQLFKNLDEKNISFPKEPVRLQLPFKTGVLDHPQFKGRVKEDFLTELRSPERGFVDNVSYIYSEEIKDYIDKQGVSSNHIYQIFNDIAENSNVFGYLTRFNRIGFVDANGKTYEDIVVKVPHPEENNGRYIVDTDSPGFAQFIESFDEYTKQFGLNSDDLLYEYEDKIDQYYDVINKEVQARGLDKKVDGSFVTGMYERYSEIRNLLSETGDEKVGLPPIRKNKQAVDEALKVLIAKAAQQGVDKIVIPPASRIALARGRELKKDKGDRFYRTYVTDLNKSLKELEDNYPVVVYRDVELPYLSKADVDDGDPFGILMNEPDFTEEDFMDMEAALQAAIDAQDPDAVIEASAKIFDAGNKGTILDISELIDKYKIEQPRQFAEGGVAMNEQMEMAFMQQGGLKDDGMRQDPVSGNQVPSGSMASEVRDDIPAQLSEGEYVVPADVVRFFGVKFFEDLRSEAKMGLQSMEANGRIGGEPVPMETGELSNEEFARLLQQELGGTLTTQSAEPIKAAKGTYVPGQMSSFNPDNYGLGFSLTPGYTPPAAVGTEPVVETEASCAAKGMVLGPDGVCIVAPKAKNDNDNDGPIVPASAAGEGQGLGGAWYKGDEEQMLNDPEAYITNQLGRGEMLDSGVARAATMVLPGGIILAAGNTFADTEGIARARAALMIAKARGSLSAEKIKSLEDAISKDTKGNFIVDKDGKGLGIGTGINYANSFAKSYGFNTLEEAASEQNRNNFNNMLKQRAKGSRIDFSRTSSKAWTGKSKEERQAIIDIANKDARKKLKASQASRKDKGISAADERKARDERMSKIDASATEEGKGGNFGAGSVTSSAVYPSRRAEGGLMLKKKRNKK